MPVSSFHFSSVIVSLLYSWCEIFENILFCLFVYMFSLVYVFNCSLLFCLCYVTHTHTLWHWILLLLLAFACACPVCLFKTSNQQLPTTIKIGNWIEKKTCTIEMYRYAVSDWDWERNNKKKRCFYFIGFVRHWYWCDSAHWCVVYIECMNVRALHSYKTNSFKFHFCKCDAVDEPRLLLLWLFSTRQRVRYDQTGHGKWSHDHLFVRPCAL